MKTEPLSVRRTADLAADRIRKGIVAGDFAAGTLLPPERDLAVRYGISRPTLRAALTRLESEGLVRSRQGEGVRVMAFKVSAGVELLPWLLSYEGARPDLVGQFLELRRTLAGEAVALACERASEADLAELDRLAAAQDAEQDDEAFVARDVQFARAVLHAARNLPMELLLNTVERVYRSREELARVLLADRSAIRGSYHAVIGLIRGRNSAVARFAVRQALEAIDTRALATLAAPGTSKKG